MSNNRARRKTWNQGALQGNPVEVHYHQRQEEMAAQKIIEPRKSQAARWREKKPVMQNMIPLAAGQNINCLGLKFNKSLIELPSNFLEPALSG